VIAQKSKLIREITSLVNQIVQSSTDSEMAKKQQPPVQSESTRKVRVYEDEDVKSIWTYDSKITKTGPISVEIQYKGELGKLYKERESKAKKAKTTSRSKKISKSVAKTKKR
jgi:hypothetical protein